MTIILILILIFLLLNCAEGFRGRRRIVLPRAGRRHLAEISTRNVSLSRSFADKDVSNIVDSINRTVREVQDSIEQIEKIIENYNKAPDITKLKMLNDIKEAYNFIRNIMRRLEKDAQLGEEAARVAEDIGSILSSEEARDAVEMARNELEESEELMQYLYKIIVHGKKIAEFNNKEKSF